MMKKVLLVLFVMLIVIQFYNPNDNQAQDVSKDDFLSMTMPPEDIKIIIKNACYDCHSNHTKYPWYSYLAPISYVINHHVEEGKEHLNFSKWGQLSSKKKNKNVEEIIEEVEEGEMPLSGYVMLHKESKISDEDKEHLLRWFSELKTLLDFESMPQ